MALREDNTPAQASPAGGHLFPSEPMPELSLVRQCDVRGVLHSHSRYGDGAHSLRAMVETAREIGFEYLGISDHFRCPSRQNGLNATGVARQREEIEALMESYPGFYILQGVEVDVGPDGRFPLSDETLAEFDYVIVSLADGHELSREDLTAWTISIAKDPRTTILGKPVGDYVLRKPPLPLDMEAVLQAAAKAGVPVEIDANPHCLELDWSCCHRAQELGVMLAISPNAHRAARLVDYRHGVELARSAGVYCCNILNTLNHKALRAYLARNR